MSATKHTITKDDGWVEVTSTTAGSLYLQSGNDLALAQASDKPVTEIVDTPLLKRLNNREGCVYFGVPDGSKIYARANNVDCELTDTASSS